MRACRAPIDGGKETCSLAVLTRTGSTCILCASTATPAASVRAATAEPSLAVATSVARGVATFWTGVSLMNVPTPAVIRGNPVRETERVRDWYELGSETGIDSGHTLISPPRAHQRECGWCL